MSFSKYFIKYLAKRAYKKTQINAFSALENQHKIFKKILSLGGDSLFSQKNPILKNCNYHNFREQIKLNTYEDLRPYIELISLGKKNILNSEKVKYFAITSGTTSGTKYIPFTESMMTYQTGAIKELLLLYAYQTGNYNLYKKKMMFIQGSPKLGLYNKIPFGKLSGITAHHIPFYLRGRRLPSMKTNSISPWVQKIKAIVDETRLQDLGIIGGIPPWVINYFEALLKKTGKKTVKCVFNNLSLYIHGGTDFSVYKKAFLDICGKIDTLEVYPASEGFFAYQNNIEEKELLLLTNHGVFYEFIKLSDYVKDKYSRVPLEGVELNTEYVMIISTICGLWAYNTGDTVEFKSKFPFKIVFCGRATQFCSAFGEHVIEKEVTTAINETVSVVGGVVSEYTVCPMISDSTQQSYHDWYIEFSSLPKNISEFKKLLNLNMEKQNPYYKDLIKSNVIMPLRLNIVISGGFSKYMKFIGKFGGQNKCPHLSNNRDIGDFLLKNYVKK